MKIRPFESRHPRMRTAIFCAALAAMFLSSPVSADNPQNITRVEEDWQITIGTADSNLNAPQITMTMTPYSGVAGHHAVFEINSRTQPDYAAGGFQLQRWYGDNCASYISPGNPAALQVANEVITFTMSMDLQGSTLTFGVSNGNSQTWGAFGSGQSLSTSVNFDGTNLNTYDANASLSNSRVGFGSNRVLQAVRTQVRYYSNGALTATDSTQRVLWQYGG